MAKSKKKNAWDEYEMYEAEMIAFEPELEEEADPLLYEAHEAINRLNTKSNKRGQLYRRPKRAENWT